MTAVIRTAWTEEELLDAFWAAQNDLGVDRLQLLRLYVMVVVERPATWDQVAIRRAFDRGRQSIQRSLGCFSCYSRSRTLHRHHVIQIQHGGSNSERNLVTVCDSTGADRGASCHQTVHLWMQPSVTSHETIQTRVDTYVAALGNALVLPYARSAV